ncbi:2-aminomuconic semialdehyde dehydrogenase-like isoform X2 [Glandiceps talaboti]
MNKIADVLESQLDEFAKAESRDQGKPVSLARTVDIPRAVYNFRFFSSSILYKTNCSTLMEDRGCLNYTMQIPIGVAGLISPWNLPLYLLTFKIAPCIAAGNTCVCKPSEMTSVTAWMLGKVLNEAGLPPGVVNIVFGTGPRAGSALVKHSDVPMISFTGSTMTAEKIRQDSAPYCKKLSLELGGKNPCIVFDDVKLDECVATTVKSCFANQGEICLCNSRLFVQKGIYDTFLEKFIEGARKVKVGAPYEDTTNMGALVSKEHLAKVKGYVNIAVTEGGTIHCGDRVDEKPDLPEKHKEGYFMKPTVVSGLGDKSRCMQEEIFGPVVCITPFDSEEEVIQRANDVKYGLAACVWSSDVGRTHRVAQKLHAGTVWANCWFVRDLNMPFGGMKSSGLGREGAKDSMEFYTEEKVICIKT